MLDEISHNYFKCLDLLKLILHLHIWSDYSVHQVNTNGEKMTIKERNVLLNAVPHNIGHSALGFLIFCQSRLEEYFRTPIILSHFCKLKHICTESIDNLLWYFTHGLCSLIGEILYHQISREVPWNLLDSNIAGMTAKFERDNINLAQLQSFILFQLTKYYPPFC